MRYDMSNTNYKERFMKKRTVIGALILSVSLGLFAQTSPDDPAIQKAKEDTVVVYDLGRIFGFINTMIKEQPKLTLTKEQMKVVYDIATEILRTERIEPDFAEELLVRIEDEVLTPDQLMYVDQLAIAREESRETTTVEKGTGTGAGQLQTYIAGGAFNPMSDDSKTIGKDFATFYEYLKGKV